MPPVVDADTHIIEHPGVFELIDPAMYARRPIQVSVPGDSQYGNTNAFWLVDGVVTPKSVGKGSILFAVPESSTERNRTDIPQEVRSVTDVRARVAALDNRDVDVEVIFPTMFLGYITDDPALDVALAKAYNRYLGRAWAESGNRVRWVMIPSVHSIADAVEEIKWSKDHGAAGVFFRGVEGNRTLVEPYFYPIYQAAMELDLPICIHTGAGSPAITSVFDRTVNHNLPQNRVLPVFAFRDIVAHKLPERFPGLRFAFIEAASCWVPYVLHHLRRSRVIPNPGTHRLGAEDMWEWAPKLFRDYNLYVACEVDEDLPYILKYVGEDNMICGSDYGHQDQSREVNMVAQLRSREDVPAAVTEKILRDNPTRLYGI